MNRKIALALTVGFAILGIWGDSAYAEGVSARVPSITGTWEGKFFTIVSGPPSVQFILGKIRMELEQQGQQVTGTGTSCKPFISCSLPAGVQFLVQGAFVSNRMVVFEFPHLTADCAPGSLKGTAVLAEDGMSFTVQVSGGTPDCKMEISTATFEKQP